MTRFPPGPHHAFPGAALLQFRRNPLAYLERTARQFGDISYWKLGRERIFFINHPDLIRDVLVVRCDNFTKGLEGAKKLLGEGLLTSDGELHRRQRQQVQPAFHHQRIAGFAETMVKQAQRARAQWRDGAIVDVTSEMLRVTLGIVGETLFGTRLESYAENIGAALTATMGSPANMLLPFAELVEKFPFPAVRRMRAGRAKLKDVINRLIDERRSSGQDRGDVLSMLVLTQHERNGGAGMSDEQLRDEAMTLLISGHETTSHALNWTWYLLAQHPEIETRLHEELDSILGSRLPTLADVQTLGFTENVFRESLRLYPPLWMMWRRAINDFEAGDYVIPAGSIVAMSQYVMHRDERFFDEPLRFVPERWTPEFKATVPRYAYFPFGGGERQCIGDSFAWMEGVLILATIAQQWKFRLARGQRVVPQPLVTLRPKGELRMTALRR